MVRRIKTPPKAQIPAFDLPRLQAAARQIVNIAEGEIIANAKLEADIMRRRLLAQRFASFQQHPLAGSTLAKKAMYARSLRVMVSTGTYANSIQAIVTRLRGGRLQVRIGFPNRLRARDTVTGAPRPGVSMNKVAFWNEHGAPRAKIPARPHWGPAMAAMRKRSPAVKKRILMLARAQFRRTLKM